MPLVGKLVLFYCAGAFLEGRVFVCHGALRFRGSRFEVSCLGACKRLRGWHLGSWNQLVLASLSFVRIGRSHGVAVPGTLVEAGFRDRRNSLADFEVLASVVRVTGAGL